MVDDELDGGVPVAGGAPAPEPVQSTPPPEGEGAAAPPSSGGAYAPPPSEGGAAHPSAPYAPPPPPPSDITKSPGYQRKLAKFENGGYGDRNSPEAQRRFREDIANENAWDSRYAGPDPETHRDPSGLSSTGTQSLDAVSSHRDAEVRKALAHRDPLFPHLPKAIQDSMVASVIHSQQRSSIADKAAYDMGVLGAKEDVAHKRMGKLLEAGANRVKQENAEVETLRAESYMDRREHMRRVANAHIDHSKWAQNPLSWLSIAVVGVFSRNPIAAVREISRQIDRSAATQKADIELDRAILRDKILNSREDSKFFDDKALRRKELAGLYKDVVANDLERIAAQQKNLQLKNGLLDLSVQLKEENNRNLAKTFRENYHLIPASKFPKGGSATWNRMGGDAGGALVSPDLAKTLNVAREAEAQQQIQHAKDLRQAHEQATQMLDIQSKLGAGDPMDMPVSDEQIEEMGGKQKKSLLKRKPEGFTPQLPPELEAKEKEYQQWVQSMSTAKNPAAKRRSTQALAAAKLRGHSGDVATHKSSGPAPKVVKGLDVYEHAGQAVEQLKDMRRKIDNDYSVGKSKERGSDFPNAAFYYKLPGGRPMLVKAGRLSDQIAAMERQNERREYVIGQTNDPKKYRFYQDQWEKGFDERMKEIRSKETRDALAGIERLGLFKRKVLTFRKHVYDAHIKAGLSPEQAEAKTKEDMNLSFGSIFTNDSARRRIMELFKQGGGKDTTLLNLKREWREIGRPYFKKDLGGGVINAHDQGPMDDMALNKYSLDQILGVAEARLLQAGGALQTYLNTHNRYSRSIRAQITAGHREVENYIKKASKSGKVIE